MANLSLSTCNICPRVTELFLSTRDTYHNVMAIPIYLHVIPIPLSWPVRRLYYLSLCHGPPPSCLIDTFLLFFFSWKIERERNLSVSTNGINPVTLVGQLSSMAGKDSEQK